MARLTRIFTIISVVVFAALLLGAVYLAFRLSSDRAEEFTDPVDHFMYGSTGGDRNFGLPYVMWEAMPSLFRDLLPEGREDEGWAAFGMIYEAEADLPPEMSLRRPVGTSLRRHLGLDRIFLNCAACHTGRVRAKPGGEPIIIPGMPSNTVDLGAFQAFLAKAAQDERFTGNRFVAEIDHLGLEMDLINRLAIKFFGAALAREQLLAVVGRFQFLHAQPTFGPGRFDTFGPAKALLDWDFDALPERERIGVVDFPSVFLQGEKEGMQLHWDGNNTNVDERNRSAAFGTGALPPILDRASLKRMADWLLLAEPPLFSKIFPDEFDADLAAQGAPVYAENCADCHGASGRDFSGPYVGQVTDIAEIATDRARLDNYTRLLSVNQNVLYAEQGAERFQSFRKTNGYANAPLDGVWLRAPYLHNGSVPTMWDLLQPSSLRPKIFLRGHDVYDPQKLGFVADPGRIDDGLLTGLFCFITDVSAADRCPDGPPEMNGSCGGGYCKGNGNFGHEYGTELPIAQKWALIEFLKTM